MTQYVKLVNIVKVVLAPDSYKECMTAQEASQAMEEAVLHVIPDAEVIQLPVADGGEGTLDVLTYATNGRIHETMVTDPLGKKVKARYSILGDKKTAVVEMAEASGLHLVPPLQRDPLLTTTYGTGELIKAALDHEITNLIVTIGGSATNDCGVGMLQALGAKITDKNGLPIGFGGGALGHVEDIDMDELDPRLRNVNISIACDVNNPLTGPKGASHVFGPQKGATPDMVEHLDKNIMHFAVKIKKATGKDILNIPGAGAAGGLGAALLICGGILRPGIDLVLDTLHFDEKMIGYDVIFTGEGKIDSQTPDGKVIAGISKRGKKAGIPVVAFVGSIKPGYESLYNEGLLSAHCIAQGPCTLEEALLDGKSNLVQTVSNVTRILARSRT